MVGKSVRGLGIFAVIAVASAFVFGLFLENSSGDFLKILELGEAGVYVFGIAFIPMALYLLYKSV